MNRLFVRIFVLLALAVFGSGALVIGYFDYSVFPAENRQLEATIGPGTTALAREIASGGEPHEVFAAARGVVGDSLAVVPLSLVPLSADERRRLAEGQPIITGEGSHRSAWARIPGQDRVVEFALRSRRNVGVQWSGLPATRALSRPATSSELQQLTPLDRARLAWRSVPLDGAGIAWTDGDTVRVAELPSRYGGRELGMGLTLLGTALAILLSLLPVRRELLALDRGAQRLRDGDLAARVELGPRVGAVGEVSQQVNAMADRVQQLVASHEELLLSVSHELQTPLARLVFSIDALQQDPERTPVLLDGMRTTVDEMRVLAEEVLQFNRLGSAGRAGLVHEPVDLVELMGDVALAFEGVTVDATGEVYVSGDARLLYRALRNLVENAVVYATPPVLRLDVGPDDVGVHVDDAGPGVPADQRDKVFAAFHRLEGSRARTTGGTGLGLAIVRRIAERHGGSTAVSDSPDGGARFTLRIPGAPRQL